MSASELAPAWTGKIERPQAGCGSVHGSSRERLQSVWENTEAELARLVGAMGVPASRAEDVLQDVYLTAWRKLPPEIAPEDIRRWLFRVTTNRCNLEHRRGARWRNVFGRLARRSSHTDNQTDAAETVSQVEQRQAVRAALQGLEPSERSMLVLRYFAELDSKEIGRILQIPDSTVRSRLRTARGQLALELKRHI